MYFSVQKPWALRMFAHPFMFTQTILVLSIIMLSLVSVTAMIPLLSAAETTHTVKVGNNGLNIDPDSVRAEVGDTVNFEFYPMNHSIAQSSYDKPCEPWSGEGDAKAIFSGYFPVNSADGEKESSKVFSIKISNTDPIWLYCTQKTHCQAGQVMVINQKDGDSETLEAYKAAAKKTDGTIVPAEVFGGVVIDHDDADGDGGEPKATKGNPGTPATVTMSHSSSMTGSKSSSSSTSAASQTNAADKLGAGAALSALPPVVAGLSIAGMCGFLA